MDRRLLVLAALLAAAPAGAANLLPNPAWRVATPNRIARGWTLVAGQGCKSARAAAPGSAVRPLPRREPRGGSRSSRGGCHATQGGATRPRPGAHPGPLPAGLYLQFHDESGRRIAEQHVRAEGPCPKWTRLQVSFPRPRMRRRFPCSSTLTSVTWAASTATTWRWWRARRRAPGEADGGGKRRKGREEDAGDDRRPATALRRPLPDRRAGRRGAAPALATAPRWRSRSTGLGKGRSASM